MPPETLKSSGSHSISGPSYQQALYALETSGVYIAVTPRYLDNESDPNVLRYCHSYTITIENRRNDTVQLLRRYWAVESDGVLITEVRGDGVVGEQPILKPSEKYTYMSGTAIPDPVGAMSGFYFFKDEQGTEITVTIPKFDLISPSMLN